MKKYKLFLSGILWCIVFGMMVLGCPNDPKEEKDTWSAVTSLEQLNGSWKGSYSETRPLSEYLELSEDEAALYGDMKVTESMEMTLTINAGAETYAVSSQETFAFSGGNINTAWVTLKAMFEQLEGITFNDSKHSATMTINTPALPLEDEQITGMLNSGLQINQNGKKIKGPLNSEEEDSPEIIMTKQ
ncbi:MAG: hypothetical protein LBO67_05815 [Spirochaetaceae bacterium]|jgi:hypothetical protein|nr:hypothetical protein [Spirochaetaceae bacterium]